MIHSPNLVDVGSAERCIQHPHNIIINYCVSHDQVGCSECMLSNHRSCAVEPIVNFASGTVDCKEYKNLLQELNEVKHQAKENERKAINNKLESDKCLSVAMLDFRTFRNDINSHLDHMEKEIVNQAKDVNVEYKITMDEKISESKKVQENVDKCLKEFEAIETNDTRLFIKMNQRKADILKFRHDAERDKPASAQCFYFEPNARLADIFRTSNILGKLKVVLEAKEAVSAPDMALEHEKLVKETQTESSESRQESQKVSYSEDHVLQNDEPNADNNLRDGLNAKSISVINSETEASPAESDDSCIKDMQICTGGKLTVKLLSDKQDCDISGIDMISEKELVLADYNNRSIKVLDMAENKITHEIKLDYHPYDLTVPYRNTIAVTLTNTIQIITKSHLLRLGDCITVDGECYGIASSRTKYFVSFIKPVPKIEILNHQGDVLQRFGNDRNQRISIVRPRYLDISPDENFIYLADFGKDSIIRLSTSGELVNSFSDASILNGPYGIYVDESGCVLVCNYGNDNICEFSADLSKCRVVLSKSAGVESPQAIFMCEKEMKLFIASTDSADCNEIQIFSHS